MTSTRIAPQTQDSNRAGGRVSRPKLSPVSFLRRAAEYMRTRGARARRPSPELLRVNDALPA